MAVIMSAFLLVASLTAALGGGRNFAGVLKHCAALTPTSADSPHSFTVKDFCFRFQCYHQLHNNGGPPTSFVMPLPCPSQTAPHNCTINMGNSEAFWPECCPFKVCPI